MNTNPLARTLLILGIFLAAFSHSKAEEGYTEAPIFNPYPAYNSKTPWNVQNFGPVGIGIDIKEPGFTMIVSNVEKGSPAEATGKLKKGQVIESINGQVLKNRDPRMILGDILAEAEATDGAIHLKITGVGDVTVNIPVLGRYSPTWPLNCPKSDKIVRRLADLHAKFDKPRWGSVIFLLSTGEEKDLEVVKRWMKDFKGVGTLNWHKGFMGPGVCEYYLRTGDATVLPVIKQMTEDLRKNMYNGGWSSRDKPAEFTYSTGTGQLHAAGMPCVTFLLMARMCGVDVDEYTLRESLKAFYRFAGHGNVAYGDTLPEGGFRDNGKTGALAVAMAAAAMLTPDGQKSIYAKARDNSAMKSFYATNWFHAAHTGGGLGEIWHHAAMSIVRESRPVSYRSFMDTRRWMMDLSRRWDGSIGIGGMTDRYDVSASESEMDWGTFLALTYTLPRKQLQLFGAPRSKFVKQYQLPVRPWGNATDDIFQSPEPIPSPALSMADILKETVEKDASLPVSLRLHAPDGDEATLNKYMHHPEFGLRDAAMRAAMEKGKYQCIVPCLKSPDARLRHLGLLAIIGNFKGKPLPADKLTPEMFDLIGKMIENREESWWVLQDAANVLARAPKETIAKHRDRLLELIQYDCTWTKMAAVTTLAKIAADPEHYKIVLPKIIKASAEFTTDGASAKTSAAIKEAVSKASPEVKAFAEPLAKQAYKSIPDELVARDGAILKWGASVVRGRIGAIVSQLPNGQEFIRQLPKATLASTRSGDPKDQFLYTAFKPNDAVVGKWLYIHTTKGKGDPISDEQFQKYVDAGYAIIERQKKETGRNGYRPKYLNIQAGGKADGTWFWSGDLLVVPDDGEARKMIVRQVGGREYLMLESGGFPSTAEPTYHCGYEIYIREK